VSARYWAFQFDDTANADGYLEFGRLWMTAMYQTSQNFATGKMEVIDYSTRDTGPSGVNFYDKKPVKGDRWGLTWDKMSADETLTFMMDEIQRKCGISEQLLVCLSPWDFENMHRRSGIFTTEKTNPILLPHASFHDSALDLIREI
jgi:hypothetical protein